jgi:hypothetical protein
MVVEVNASVLASFAIKAPAIKGMIWPSIWLHGTFGHRDSWVASSAGHCIVIGHIVHDRDGVDSKYLSSS